MTQGDSFLPHGCRLGPSWSPPPMPRTSPSRMVPASRTSEVRSRSVSNRPINPPSPSPITPPAHQPPSTPGAPVADLFHLAHTLCPTRARVDANSRSLSPGSYALPDARACCCELPALFSPFGVGSSGAHLQWSFEKDRHTPTQPLCNIHAAWGNLIDLAKVSTEPILHDMELYAIAACYTRPYHTNHRSTPLSLTSPRTSTPRSSPFVMTSSTPGARSWRSSLAPLARTSPTRSGPPRWTPPKSRPPVSRGPPGSSGLERAVRCAAVVSVVCDRGDMSSPFSLCVCGSCVEASGGVPAH